MDLDRPQPQREPDEVTPGGSRVYRHQEAPADETLSGGDWEGIDVITRHIEEHLGPVESVFHELISPRVHIDVHVIRPTEERPFTFLVTTGMSEIPMNVPPGAEEWQYAELIVTLPPDWELSQESFKDERNYWPIRWLKTLARFPHDFATWLSHGHSIPTGDPSVPVCEGSNLNGFLILTPLIAGKGMVQLTVSPTQTIHFYSLVPVYQEEMDFKLQQGCDALLKKFDQFHVTDLIDPRRTNVITGRKAGGNPWWRRWFSK